MPTGDKKVAHLCLSEEGAILVLLEEYQEADW